MRLSVVIPARDEAKTIATMIRRLKRWHRHPEIIVVANGCTDDTAELAYAAGARVFDIPEPLGHDVGRVVGLAAVTGDIALILDADILFTLSELEPFVTAVEQGTDVALNRYPLRTSQQARHPTAVAKRSLNLLLHRKDLGCASLTAVPHALSRKALETIDLALFAAPPVAQAEAVLQGLRVQTAAYVPVGWPRNRRRGSVESRRLTRLIIGDCLEAIQRVHSAWGPRAVFTDLNRKRKVLTEFQHATNARKEPSRFRALAVVPVRDEADRLPQVLRAARRSLDAVCVISNGSHDETVRIASRQGALTEEFDEPLGHDVGRAVGCFMHSAQRYVFLDGDVRITARDLAPFVRPRPLVEVALNDLDAVLPKGRRMDAVSVVKRFLNLALKRPDLGIASMTAVPHSLSASSIQKIGVEHLAVPPVAHVRAIVNGCTVKAVHGVDVVKLNRFREAFHSPHHGRPLEKLILGDHAEAIAHLQTLVGPRGYFPDTLRRRDWLDTWLPDNRYEAFDMAADVETVH
ncbi:MAG: glycosyltransferase [Alicyclobacillus sp.]|nr:glycosyltransferase [Alicyclobacillus sp.]